jgi:outer membrane protein insertion porin family
VIAFVLAALLQDPAAAPREGEPVAAVRIAGESSERLRRYVEIRPGEPYRAELVRHAAELLYATGDFEDVRVDAERPAGGLELTFRPQAAPRLRAFRLEGDRVLSPRTLQRIADLREGERLVTGRLERASRDAALRLAGEGYLEARVAARVERHDGQADAVFQVHSGPQVRVTDVAVEGGPAEMLTPLIAPHPGRPFERARATRAAERMRRRLVEAGLWRATVDVRDSYDPTSSRLRLVFHVEPGPLTFLEFAGGRLSRGLRSSVTELLREGALRGDVLEEATDRIEQHLRGEGYRAPAVSYALEPRPGGEALVFTVEPGPRARVASVRLVGEVPAGLEVPLATRAGEPLQDRRVEDDVAALVKALEERGHPEPRVEAEIPEGGGEVAVVFRITPGPRARVASVRVDSPVALAREAAPQELRLRAGSPYRVRDLARDREGVLAAYRNAGYAYAEVRPEVTLSADRSEAAVLLRVEPGPRLVVDHVVISGLRQTREEVVRRELSLREDAPLGLRDVLESQRRLSALGIFDRVSVAEMDPESKPARSVVVAVEEAAPTTIAYGLGYGEREQVRASVEVARRNIFGMDRSLSGFARFSFRGSRVLATFREPYLLGRRQELFVTAFREEEDRPGFDFVRFGSLVQTGRNLSTTWSLILRYVAQQTVTFNVEVPCIEIDREFCDSTVSGPSVSVVNDTRDDALDPRRGRFLGGDVQVSHHLLGGDTLVKAFLQAATYQRLAPRALLALSARLGLGRTFAGEPSLLPPGERFFAGGDYSMRGFAVDTVNPDGGNALVLGGMELRFDATRYLSAAAFTEAGNVYSLVGDVDFNDLRYTAGLGLRYRSAFGPLRFDWGYKLNRRPGERPFHLHFTVGHAF